ncbi:helix-turn-helix transcriptional regulator [Tuanshanicoccus lijuaniae]|uniref:helix-turn-helix transcriptional regulator n=1 Tax=Aerococcaceae bacterium zg-1292 TaxID=2774330 RepID=UPI0019378A05|nr:helix-turn-helix transcriptional regulator [Aerococcaceae bacterium zg-1292]MBF6625637.1 helix-turn-helix transcriptional regulator [Aerococcaceae bacterium zg-BR9]MBF6977820.1 helix-turn-helix transcriptional regulator [Aerococcaceae bacterium zg-BR22]QQA36312.1 helix-turn-helix transcriptional regulator [Aerococcaceae bacterium zg-1292]
MNQNLELKNRLKAIRTEKKLTQQDLADRVGVSRNTISSIETGTFCPTSRLALILCIALDKKFEDIFYFDLEEYCACEDTLT